MFQKKPSLLKNTINSTQIPNTVIFKWSHHVETIIFLGIWGVYLMTKTQGGDPGKSFNHPPGLIEYSVLIQDFGVRNPVGCIFCWKTSPQLG